MRGQRLFIRPIEAEDGPLIESFLAENGCRDAVPACGLVGKLVGELVAIVALEIGRDEIRVANVVVSKDLRRKRIGRFMLDEVEGIARKLERHQIVVIPPAEAQEFFRRTGFREQEREMIRKVARAH